MNFRKVVFGVVFLVMVVICLVFYISFVKTHLTEKNVATSPVQLPPVSGLPAPPSNSGLPRPEQIDFCLSKKDTKDEIKESVKNKGWNTYINYRDYYQIDYPSKELSIVSNTASNAGGGYWSSTIGYVGRLGAYGDMVVHCGNIDSAFNAHHVDEETYKIIDKKQTTINGMSVLIVYSKIIKQPEIPTLKAISEK